MTTADAATRQRIEAVWREESPRIIGRLARLVGDVGVAEDLAQDAFVTALARWPVSGLPDNPGAWLTAVGKQQAVDLVRRRDRLGEKYAEIGQELRRRGDRSEEDFDRVVDDRVDDDVLGLMLMTCRSASGCGRSSTWSGWSSTRVTPPPRERTGCAPTSARRPCGSAGCWRGWRPSSPTCMR